jgi:membrane protein
MNVVGYLVDPMAASSAFFRTQPVAIAKEAFAEFQRHKGPWLAAAIAYFTTFAIAPLIIVIVQLVGLVLGEHQGTLDALHGYLERSAGKAAADGISSIVATTFAQRHSGALAQIISWLVFIVAAVGLFASLRVALNTVWDVKPAKQGLFEMLRSRLLSFGIVLAVAFLLLVSLTVTSLLTAGAQALQHVFPGFPSLVKVVDFVVSLAVITALFALLFTYLPERRIAWRDVWLGAAISAVLFVIGQFLLSSYLGRTALSSMYGAFGGLVVFLFWVNYSAQILLFGAELTQVFARRHMRS